MNRKMQHAYPVLDLVSDPALQILAVWQVMFTDEGIFRLLIEWPGKFGKQISVVY